MLDLNAGFSTQASQDRTLPQRKSLFASCTQG
jgi:hypothetical protein